jgi:hypothetical protein
MNQSAKSFCIGVLGLGQPSASFPASLRQHRSLSNDPPSFFGLFTAQATSKTGYSLVAALNDPDLCVTEVMAEPVNNMLGIGAQDDATPDAKAHKT